MPEHDDPFGFRGTADHFKDTVRGAVESGVPLGTIRLLVGATVDLMRIAAGGTVTVMSILGSILDAARKK